MQKKKVDIQGDEKYFQKSEKKLCKAIARRENRLIFAPALRGDTAVFRGVEAGRKKSFKIFSSGVGGDKKTITFAARFERNGG